MITITLPAWMAYLLTGAVVLYIIIAMITIYKLRHHIH